MSNHLSGWEFRCERCGERHAPSARLWHCPACGGALAMIGPDRVDTRSIQHDAPGIWRYGNVLPARPGSGRFLGEGMTPLVSARVDGHEVHLKLDSLLPTGSFKDRGASLLARFLRDGGIERIVLDSSGNAASAMAAYAAATGLECVVYVPANASPGKLVQARAFGASVVPVEGSREDVASAAQRAVEADESAMYASHNWHPVFVEGVKTWALEVWEQLGYRKPDLAFVPTGGGSALVAAWRGFSTLAEPGAVLPRLVGCQPAACAPVAEAWLRGDEIRAVSPGPTLAEGTRIALPSRPVQIMDAIRSTEGFADAVSEVEIVNALHLLAGQGIYVEPTAAVAVAACRRAIERGDVSEDDLVVVHVTGNGLKATDTIAALVAP
jgi:threonine synthase